MENTEKSCKKNKKCNTSFFWGAALIAVGIIWLLCTLDFIHLSFGKIIRYIIPFSMIACGAMLLIKSKTAKFITLAVCFVVFLLLLVFADGNRGRHCDRHWSRHLEGKHHFRGGHHRFGPHGMRAEFDVDVKQNGVIDLEVAAGAAALKITGKTTDNYLDIYRNGELKESITADVKDKTVFIGLGDKRHGKHKNNEAEVEEISKSDFADLEMALNGTSTYDLSLALGAVASNFDISAYKVQKVDIETGASSVEVTLGDKVEKVNVEIEAGAGSITLRIPKNSGCKVVSKGFLVEKELPEFTKINGAYQTDNFETATNTVFVKFEGAVSNLEVVRY